jgi:hypothetical protein
MVCALAETLGRSDRVGTVRALLLGMTTKQALRFSRKAAPTLHAVTCSVVASGSNERKGIIVILEGVEAQVAGLKERGFKVRQCACCK